MAGIVKRLQKGMQTLTDKVSSLETRNSELLRENRRLAAENQKLEILLKAADVEIKRLKGEPELEIARFFKTTSQLFRY